jgi:hypothetical protein
VGQEKAAEKEQVMRYQEALSELVEALLDGDKIYGTHRRDFYGQLTDDDVEIILFGEGKDYAMEKLRRLIESYIETEHQEWVYERMDEHDADQRAEHAEAMADARRMMEEAI